MFMTMVLLLDVYDHDDIIRCEGNNKLSLTGMALTELPMWLKSHSAMVLSLDLSHNHFSVFPLVVTSLRQTQVLSINHNLLRTLPSEIGFLNRLEFLHADHNKLISLPSEIGIPNILVNMTY